ncbi:Uncharacterized protein TCM_011367 [Theobroma cacao]|uniref:RNase H type-1 domain-containing protein n=1 Tax=Theobroma cacao TaxID=3641 RepID=A0A061EA35_THECC|nr:Uncharacterized protein TCM_011367 [Theobroma cacao]
MVVGVSDARLAEVRAIKEVFLIFSASKWALSHSFVIESNSIKAVKWVNAPAEAPWRFRKWILHIGKMKKGLKKREDKWRLEISDIFLSSYDSVEDVAIVGGVVYKECVLQGYL